MGFEDRQHWWVVCVCVCVGVCGGGDKWSPPCPLSLTPPLPPPSECAYLMSPTANQQLNLPLLCKS